MDSSQLFDAPEARAILQERARALAQQDVAAADGLGTPTLSFVLSGAPYCLPAAAVRETQLLGAVTRLPAVPPAIVGLVNVRGRLLVCIDLRPLLDLPPQPPGPGSLLLIISGAGVDVGLLVDAISEVSLRHANLAPTPAAVAGCGVPWVRGVDQDLALHIDPDLLLGDQRLLAHDSAELAMAV